MDVVSVHIGGRIVVDIEDRAAGYEVDVVGYRADQADPQVAVGLSNHGHRLSRGVQPAEGRVGGIDFQRRAAQAKRTSFGNERNGIAEDVGRRLPANPVPHVDGKDRIVGRQADVAGERRDEVDVHDTLSQPVGLVQVNVLTGGGGQLTGQIQIKAVIRGPDISTGLQQNAGSHDVGAGGVLVVQGVED